MRNIKQVLEMTIFQEKHVCAGHRTPQRLSGWKNGHRPIGLYFTFVCFLSSWWIIKEWVTVVPVLLLLL